MASETGSNPGSPEDDVFTTASRPSTPETASKWTSSGLGSAERDVFASSSLPLAVPRPSPSTSSSSTSTAASDNRDDEVTLCDSASDRGSLSSEEESDPEMLHNIQKGLTTRCKPLGRRAVLRIRANSDLSHRATFVCAKNGPTSLARLRRSVVGLPGKLSKLRDFVDTEEMCKAKEDEDFTTQDPAEPPKKPSPTPPAQINATNPRRPQSDSRSSQTTAPKTRRVQLMDKLPF